MRVGHLGYNYKEKRNILNPCSGADFVNVHPYNLYSYLNKINFIVERKWGKVPFPVEYYQYRHWKKPPVDLLHFFNHISYNVGMPFVVTFSSAVPYFAPLYTRFKQWDRMHEITRDPSLLRALDRLASPDCKALIAISDNAKKIQLNVLELFPDYQSALRPKIQVIHPPQSLFSGTASRRAGAITEFLFVGLAFFRKGGQVILDAVQTLSRDRQDFHVHVVSGMDTDGGYAGYGEEDVKQAKIRMEASAQITHYPHIPHAQVMELMGRCHVGLLPTWQDTYGYSVLEFQSAGCPVITTDHRALGEINSPQLGWVITTEHDPIGEMPTGWELNRESWHTRQVNALVKKMEEAMNGPEEVARKAVLCRQHIENNHSVQQHGQRIHEIYQRGLS
jgi:glycosyltransferase involved in cell wall biosynthesis